MLLAASKTWQLSVTCPSWISICPLLGLLQSIARNKSASSSLAGELHKIEMELLIEEMQSNLSQE